MSLRIGFWVVGILVGTVVALRIAPGSSAGLTHPACWGSVLAIGLFGELVYALRSLATMRKPTVPAGARPPDGRVEILPMREVQAEPNVRDPQFRRFQSLDPPETPTKVHLPRTRLAPPLLGRVAIVSVFLGRDGQGWSDDEIAEAHAALIRAGTWVEEQAIRWNAPVNLLVADTYFVVDDHEPDDIELTFVPEGEGMAPFEARAVSKALIDLSRAAARLGFRDAEDWLARINPRVQADVHVWLLHPRRAGRSLAVPLDQTDLLGVSLAVCYAREANVPEPLVGPPFTDPVTVAHELMHLFGATDKYRVPLRAFAPRTVSSRDIMRLHESRLSRLRVDPRTAGEIGWLAAPWNGQEPRPA